MRKPDFERITSIQKLADSGMTIKEIASKLRIPYASVAQYKNRYNLAIKRSCKIKDKIIELHSQYSVSEMSFILNYPEVYIRSLLVAYGLKCKPKSKHTYKPNHYGPNEAILFNQTNKRYIESHSFVDSAKYFDVTPITISRWCKRHKVVRNKKIKSCLIYAKGEVL